MPQRWGVGNGGSKEPWPGLVSVEDLLLSLAPDMNASIAMETQTGQLEPTDDCIKNGMPLQTQQSSTSEDETSDSGSSENESVTASRTDIQRESIVGSSNLSQRTSQLGMPRPSVTGSRAYAGHSGRFFIRHRASVQEPGFQRQRTKADLGAVGSHAQGTENRRLRLVLRRLGQSPSWRVAVERMAQALSRNTVVEALSSRPSSDSIVPLWDWSLQGAKTAGQATVTCLAWNPVRVASPERC